VRPGALEGDMKNLLASSTFFKSILPWLFPPAYVIHATEEFLGGGALAAATSTNLKGVNLNAKQFLIINGIAFLILIVAIVLPHIFRFPEWMLVCLGTILSINAVSHTVSTVMMREYNPGVITGLLIFLPLGAITLLGLKSRMSTRRYLTAVAVGIAVHGIIMLLALRGGHLVRL
jgi:hypothetical protein